MFLSKAVELATSIEVVAKEVTELHSTIAGATPNAGATKHATGHCQLLQVWEVKR